ncbi:SpoIID/LytB domain protein [Rippkaea orientalis PCC 8801]|uniref:SpoIID/LytB domain protein n=1 Tax=Rippkaea orientalis (strain PCC 8801 / RF-1) TaxID=41431 RepID=B7JWM3_RIPO1|nr:SpoIID/LytB domain-containing protein [Rippkaea orientalis]ACK68364.1 SpoIID/LytB domain protein [Rippkaea orientalis PCC 8801]
MENIKTRNPGRGQQLLATLFFLPILVGGVLTSPVTAKDIEIEVGVVQRFGEKDKETLAIQGTNGDTLTLVFSDSNGREQTLKTNQFSIEVNKQSLPQPTLQERLVLSDHATFETAEDSANQWREKGIKVEVTQPGRWQVWAKRDVYETPLLRRWLLQSLKTKGFKDVYLESAMLPAKPQATFTVAGQRYNANYLEIIPAKNPVQVNPSKGETRVYGGHLKLQPNAYGTYTLVNNVPLETYLRGVVPHEIGPQAPANAAKAQTIIARTYALRNLRRFQADDYQLCADTHCQVYYGLSGTSAKADQAIAQTKGLVLTYQNELVDALYSSTTGGVTASFNDVWNGEERPYLKAVIDSPKELWNLSEKSLANEQDFRNFISLKDGFNETGRNVFRWNRQASIESLSKDLQQYLTKRKHPLANFQKIEWMEVTERSSSGRILTLKVQTDKGVLTLHKNEVRSAFGPPRSTLFYLQPIYDNQKQLKAFAFVGGGFGHGVGMSQYGSYNLAKLGWTADKILAFYYPGATIKPLDSSIVFWPEQE